MSRRTLLIALGIGGAALAGGRILDSPHLRHELGLSRSPDRSVPNANVPQVSGELNSRYLGRRVSWTVSQPPGPLLGVVYALHGKDNDHRFAFDEIHLDDFAADAGLPFAVASVDGGADSYWHRRADGTDAHAMLMREFVPMVQSGLGHPRPTIMGWSMGGYGALLAAERSPGTFHAVAVGSPALWLSPDATSPGAFDGPSDYAANDVFSGLSALADTPVRVDCGTGDPFYGADRHLAARLTGPHAAHFGSGYHDAPFWRSVAPPQLRFLAAALSGRKSPREHGPHGPLSIAENGNSLRSKETAP